MTNQKNSKTICSVPLISPSRFSLIGGAFLLISMSALADQWVETKRNFGGGTYFDMDSLKKDGDIFTVRTVDNFTSPDAKIKSVEYVFLIRCNPGGEKLVSYSAYKEQYAKGETIHVLPPEALENNSAGFHDVQKKNMSMYKLFCKLRRR